jgi:hypothetical protein
MAVEKNTQPEENQEEANEEKKQELEVEVVETDEETVPKQVVNLEDQLMETFYKKVILQD